MQTATCYTTKEPKDNILYINKKAKTKIPKNLTNLYHMVTTYQITLDHHSSYCIISEEM